MDLQCCAANCDAAQPVWCLTAFDHRQALDRVIAYDLVVRQHIQLIAETADAVTYHIRLD